MAQPTKKDLLKRLKELEREANEKGSQVETLKKTGEKLKKAEEDLAWLSKTLEEKELKINQLADEVVEADSDYLTMKRLIQKLSATVLFYERKLSNCPEDPSHKAHLPKPKKDAQKQPEPKPTGYALEPIQAIRANCKILRESLITKVKGQEEAVEQIRKALRGHFSPMSEKKPTAFLLTGPTGVGKTYTAKVLNDVLFEGLAKKPVMLTIFGGDFGAEHEVSKLIGAPPGYIGHEQEGSLVQHIRENPEFSIILVDEIEKADPRLCDFLLRLMDEGKVTGNRKGEVHDCSKYVIIMTSNIGEKEASLTKAPIGIANDAEMAKHEKREGIIEGAVKGYFAPEFRNRLKGIIHFKYLGEKEAEGILEKEIEEMNHRSADTGHGYGATVSLTEEAKRQIITEGFSKEFGARELKRTLERNVTESDKLLDILEEGDNALVDFREGEFVYEPV